MNKEQKPPKLDTKAVGRLFSYITKKHRPQFIVVVITVLISNLSGVFANLFIQVLIDDYIVPLSKTPNPVFTGLLKAVALMGVVTFVGVIANFVYTRLMAVMAQKIQKQIRDEMFTHMQSLPVSYFDSHTFGETMSHYTNDIDTLRQMLSQSIPQLLGSGTGVIFTFIAMLFSNRYLTGVIVIFMFGVIQFTKYVTGNSGVYFGKQQQSLAEINGFVEEMINGQKVVKVFNHEEQAKADFDRLNAAIRENATKANTFANILMPVMMNLGNLLYIILAIIGGIIAANGGGISIGALASFLQLTKGFTNPISQMSQQINMVIMAVAGAGRVFAFLDEEPEQDNGYVTLVNAVNKGGDIIPTEEYTGNWAWEHPHQDGTITYTQLRGDVNFFDLDFSYIADRKVLKNVSLYAKHGQKIALVGATGAGKTTITNLINRFYDIDDGKIQYDGININKIKKSDLRRSLGMVLQNTHLFTGTIADNIRYGKLGATEQEVESAAKLANADGFIARLPLGYNTEISGSNDNLSQGQKQLISIARAAIANPPVMILDEATSSIDTHTEALVQKGMDGLMKGRTVFVIAHRLSTVRNADAILVLDNGMIIERGNHDQLIAEKRRYYQLYTGAFELE